MYISESSSSFAAVPSTAKRQGISHSDRVLDVGPKGQTKKMDSYMFTGSLSGGLVLWKLISPVISSTLQKEAVDQASVVPEAYFIPRALLLRESSSPVIAMARSTISEGDRDVLVAVTADGCITSWGVVGGRCYRSTPVLPPNFLSTRIIVFNIKRNNVFAEFAALVGTSKSVPIFNLRTRKIVRELRHRYPVMDIALVEEEVVDLPIAKRQGDGGNNNTGGVSDPDGGANVQNFTHSTSSFLVTLCADGMLETWDMLETLDPPHPDMEHPYSQIHLTTILGTLSLPSQPMTLSVSADGRRILVAMERHWFVCTSDSFALEFPLVHCPTGLSRSRVRGCRFFLDEDHVALWNDKGEIFVYELPPSSSTSSSSSSTNPPSSPESSERSKAPRLTHTLKHHLNKCASSFSVSIHGNVIMRGNGMGEVHQWVFPLEEEKRGNDDDEVKCGYDEPLDSPPTQTLSLSDAFAHSKSTMYSHVEHKGSSLFHDNESYLKALDEKERGTMGRHDENLDAQGKPQRKISSVSRQSMDMSEMDIGSLRDTSVYSQNPCTASVMFKYHPRTEALVLARGYRDGTIEINTLLSNTIHNVLHAHSGRVTNLLAIPMQESPLKTPLLLSAAEDGDICVWIIQSGQLIGVFESNSPVTALFRPTTVSRAMRQLMPAPVTRGFTDGANGKEKRGQRSSDGVAVPVRAQRNTADSPADRNKKNGRPHARKRSNLEQFQKSLKGTNVEEQIVEGSPTVPTFGDVSWSQSDWEYFAKDDYVFSVDEDHAVRCYHLGDFSHTATLRGHDSTVVAVFRDEYCENAGLVVTKTSRGTVYVWDLSSGNLERVLYGEDAVALLHARHLNHSTNISASMTSGAGFASTSSPSGGSPSPTASPSAASAATGSSTPVKGSSSGLGRPRLSPSTSGPDSLVRSGSPIQSSPSTPQLSPSASRKRHNRSPTAISTSKVGGAPLMEPSDLSPLPINRSLSRPEFKAQAEPLLLEHEPSEYSQPRSIIGRIDRSDLIHVASFGSGVSNRSNSLHMGMFILNVAKLLEQLSAKYQELGSKKEEEFQLCLEKDEEIAAYNGMLSYLFEWGADDTVDEVLTAKLGFHNPFPKPSFAELSHDGIALTVLFPNQSRGIGRWEFDPQLTATHSLALSTVCMALLNHGHFSQQIYYSRVVAHYTVVLPSSTPTFVEPSADQLAVYALNENEGIHSAARLLLQGLFERATPEQRATTVRQWTLCYTESLEQLMGQGSTSKKSAERTRQALEFQDNMEMMASLVICLIGVFEYTHDKIRKRNIEDQEKMRRRKLEEQSEERERRSRDGAAQNARSRGGSKSKPAPPSGPPPSSSLSSRQERSNAAPSSPSSSVDQQQEMKRQSSAPPRLPSQDADVSSKPLVDVMRGAHGMFELPFFTGQSVTGTLLKLIYRGDATKVSSFDKVKVALAAELIGKAFPILRLHIPDLSSLMKRLLILSTSGSDLTVVCHRSLLQTGFNSPEEFISTMGREALDPKNPERVRQSALIAIVSLVKKYPTALADSRVLITAVENIVQCLDPSEPVIRKSLLQASTAALHTLVQKYPMLAFHQKQQMFAAGLGRDNDSLLVIYDLRTATKWRILEGHTGTITGVSFNPSGNCIVSYSHDEDPPSVRSWNISSQGFLSSFLGISGSHDRLYKLAPTRRPYSTTECLPSVRVRWLSDTSVQLFREDSSEYKFTI